MSTTEYILVRYTVLVCVVNVSEYQHVYVWKCDELRGASDLTTFVHLWTVYRGYHFVPGLILDHVVSVCCLLY